MILGLIRTCSICRYTGLTRRGPRARSESMMAKDIVDRRYRIWLLLLLLLALGLSAWIYELTYGLATTGMRGVISWGLYICTFVFLVKLSAGGLIVASSAEVFDITALRPLAKLGALTAAVCISLAGLT